MAKTPGAERKRLEQDRSGEVRWRAWGPYLSERAWATVREDYSATGDAWGYFPHEHARSRAYRWNEDGLAGVCDRRQTWCLALALWNGQDRMLKERMFGLGGPEGNHAEDVKELYFYEDATPTSSYLRTSYIYPHAEYPYERLASLASKRTVLDPEPELEDLGLLADGRFFDVTVEYAKASDSDIFMVITVANRHHQSAEIHLLPQFWFRNTWSWSGVDPSDADLPSIIEGSPGAYTIAHPLLKQMWLYVQEPAEALFTHNETNADRLFGSPSRTALTKDAFHRRIVDGEESATAKAGPATKCGFWRTLRVAGNGSERMVLRLCTQPQEHPFENWRETLADRRSEADDFYDEITAGLSNDRQNIVRQSLSGLFWGMQFYHYDVARWQKGDLIAPPDGHGEHRNQDWKHIVIRDVLSMPDCWEYPWFAAWDSAFHAVAMAPADVDEAKRQLKYFVKEWYQHPNGQIPAYEWEFSDLNPPVLAWATFQVYKYERRQRGTGDRIFLERIFHKLLINFAWWVNKKDEAGNNIFEGGFLGLDNISVLDRSEPLSPGVRLEQADATAWMAMYCLDLMRIAIELAQENSAYEDMASKFFEHFLRIAYALHHPAPGSELAPWDEAEGFFFDILLDRQGAYHIPVRSLVGLIPLFASCVFEADELKNLPNFRRRASSFLERNPHLGDAAIERDDNSLLLSAVPVRNLARLLGDLFDEERFLSPFGPRSLSKEHADAPVVLWLDDGRKLRVQYEPGESQTRMKGGNSNWRGPVWMPAGYMLYHSLLRYDRTLGDSLKIPFRDGFLTPGEGAQELARRMTRIFDREPNARRPLHGRSRLLSEHPSFHDRLLFFEYFHAETGEGLGASHQTGWTAIIGDLILRSANGC